MTYGAINTDLPSSDLEKPFKFTCLGKRKSYVTMISAVVKRLFMVSDSYIR